MFSKEHWPTKSKLAVLRRAGRLPYSASASSIFVLLILWLTLIFNTAKLKKLVTWEAWLDTSSANAQMLLLNELADLIVLLASAALIAYFFIGLLQNLFFFKPGLLAFRADRFSYQNVGNPISVLVRMLWLFFIALVSALMFFYFALRQLSVILDFKAQDFSNFSNLGAASVTIIVSMCLLVIIIFSLLCAHLAFRVRYRMSHEDFKSELRNQL